MCTYRTERLELSGSAKGPQGWFRFERANVYYDHPVHEPVEHSLNIDFLRPQSGPSARVAVEMSAQAARELAEAILASLPQG
ncbi:MAG: DUF6295 family protein [Acidimicrobiales bacterium]